jgi:glucose-1-phosphate cytidylyltransferase
MKAVILAGGLGTRLAEETQIKPKPMVEIGGKPILWHILKTYSHHGIQDFIICLGYKGYLIKEYFTNYLLHNSDLTLDLTTNRIDIHQRYAEPWRITLVDTGEHTQTGGRLGRVRRFLEGEETFCFTYGDGVGDIDITALIRYHQAHGKAATVTAVTPPGRFGALGLEGEAVVEFTEKPKGDNGLNQRRLLRPQPPHPGSYRGRRHHLGEPGHRRPGQGA